MVSTVQSAKLLGAMMILLLEQVHLPSTDRERALVGIEIWIMGVRLLVVFQGSPLDRFRVDRFRVDCPLKECCGMDHRKCRVALCL